MGWQIPKFPSWMDFGVVHEILGKVNHSGNNQLHMYETWPGLRPFDRYDVLGHSVMSFLI